jgi:hypothetical protein
MSLPRCGLKHFSYDFGINARNPKAALAQGSARNGMTAPGPPG